MRLYGFLFFFLTVGLSSCYKAASIIDIEKVTVVTSVLCTHISYLTFYVACNVAE